MIKLSEFENNFLVKEYYKELIFFQRNMFNPNILGLIEQDNCFDQLGYIEYISKKDKSGNIRAGVRNYNLYKCKFNSYLDLLIELGDLPIYENKEMFFKSFFLSEDSLLTFFPLNKEGRKTRHENNHVDIDYFNSFDFKRIENMNYEGEEHSRILKNGVARYFYKKMLKPSNFNHNSCYMTLSLKDITDDMFNDVFKASNFKTENSSYEHPIQFKIKELIEKMIKSGVEYDSNNPLDNFKTISYTNFKHNEKISVLVFENDTNKKLTKNYILKEKEVLSEDSIIILEEHIYRIVSIEKENTNNIIIKVKEERTYVE